MTICNVCNKNEVPQYRKTQCDVCAKAKEDAWNAKNNPVVNPIPAQPFPVNPPVENTNTNNVTPMQVKPPTGEYKSLVYNKTLSANSFEVGKATGRFKFYFETIGELKAKIKEAVDSGLMVEFELSDPFKPEHVPHD